MPEIVSQRSTDDPAIERLLDVCFGPDRHSRPSYRLRDGIAPLAGLGFVAHHAGRLVGTLRFWPATVGGEVPALLLGPLAVDPDYRGRGLSRALVARGLDEARKRGHRIVVAIGEPSVFDRFGFSRGRALGLIIPGAVDEARFLALELDPGALTGIGGVIGRAGSRSPAQRSSLSILTKSTRPARRVRRSRSA